MLRTEKPGLWCSWAENERCKLTERGHDAEVGFAGMTETPRNGRNHPKQSGIKPVRNGRVTCTGLVAYGTKSSPLIPKLWNKMFLKKNVPIPQKEYSNTYTLFEFGIKKENENKGFLKNMLYDPMFGRWFHFG